MQDRQHNLRKAAILVASLETFEADRLLEQMGPQQAGLVRQFIMELDEVDPDEQRDVIEEFFRIGPLATQQSGGGVELDIHPDAAISSAVQVTLTSTAAQATPFGFLAEVDDRKLSEQLEREHPQTAALVIAHLSPTRAAGLLGRLPENMQMDVARRLSDLEETSPEIISEVERELQKWAAQLAPPRRRRATGVATMQSILDAADSRLKHKLLSQMAGEVDPPPRTLPPMRIAPRPRLAFEQLLTLDDSQLLEVLRAADPDLVVLALAGASPELVQRITRRLPSPVAKKFSGALAHLGPTRLSDVEQAQQELADLASRLTDPESEELPFQALSFAA